MRENQQRIRREAYHVVQRQRFAHLFIQTAKLKRKAPHMIIAFFVGEKLNTYFKYLWALPLGSLIVIKYLRDTYGR